MDVVLKDQQGANLLPVAVNELYQGINALCRTFRKTCEGLENGVDGVIHPTNGVLTLMLRQQREKLLAELAPA